MRRFLERYRMYISSLPLCYTTKTGIKIGCRYERPLPQLNLDEEIIQGVLLGDSSVVYGRRNFDVAMSLTLFIVIAIVLASWGK